MLTRGGYANVLIDNNLGFAVLTLVMVQEAHLWCTNNDKTSVLG